MSKDFDIKMTEVQAQHVDAPTQPEVLLWLAVIERAIADYCAPAKELTDFFKQDLYGFFFEEHPRQYNLVYICSMLLDREDAVSKIRKRLANYTHFEKTRSYRSSSF
jgi:hypothetical protein